MNNGKHKIGSVFNLDDHDEPGSHWVSLYMELNHVVEKSFYLLF